MVSKQKIIVIILAVIFCVVSAVGSLIPTSEMEERVEQLQDDGYTVTKASWDNILSAYPIGSVDEWGCEFVYASTDNWDEFKEALEGVYVLCVNEGIEYFFKVWYDESHNKIFFLAPEGVLIGETNYIVYYTTKN